MLSLGSGGGSGASTELGIDQTRIMALALARTLSRGPGSTALLQWAALRHQLIKLHLPSLAVRQVRMQLALVAVGPHRLGSRRSRGLVEQERRLHRQGVIDRRVGWLMRHAVPLANRRPWGEKRANCHRWRRACQRIITLQRTIRLFAGSAGLHVRPRGWGASI